MKGGILSFKEKILSKSNSYQVYKEYYETHHKEKVVNWEQIFNRIVHDKEMFCVTVEGIYENFSNGHDEMKYCPICGYETPIFIAGGVNYRKNAMCPNCNSLERHRFLYFFIENRINLTNNFQLLHFAPEKAFYDIFKNLDNVDYHTCDIEKSVYVNEIIDIQDIPYDNDFFNLIICNHVLEHVPDDKKAMSELYRVIKPVSENGGAIIMVPLDLNMSETLEKEEYNTPELREKYYGQSDHVRLYGADFQNKLEDAGFDVEVFDNNSSVHHNLIKYGFGKEEMLFYCTKK